MSATIGLPLGFSTEKEFTTEASLDLARDLGLVFVSHSLSIHCVIWLLR
jgi:hypothetical protein